MAENRQRRRREPSPAAIDLLKTLLRLRAEAGDVAPRLIANSEDIERLALTRMMTSPPCMAGAWKCSARTPSRWPQRRAWPSRWRMARRWWVELEEEEK